jgi:hypothetical protein
VEQLKSLGHIDLAPSAPGAGGEAPTPRVWINAPDRSAEGAVVGAIIGGIGGAIAGGAAASAASNSWPSASQVDIWRGAAVGAAIGAPVGGVIGALLGKPGPRVRAAASELSRHAAAVDVSSLARDGASRSSKLQAYRDLGPEAGPGGTLTVEVVAYGTRAEMWSKNLARPFVAVRTRLANASTGRVIYDSISDLRGEKRRFYHWSDGEGADFRRELEDCALGLGQRSVNRALTPRRR